MKRCHLEKNLIVRTADFAMHLLSQYVRPGDCVIDATAGNGNDTLTLARLTDAAHGAGRVYSFDIQQAAIDNTRFLLEKNGLACESLPAAYGDKQEHKGEHQALFAKSGVVLIRDSHDRIKDYVCEPVAGAVFNLGFLPGQDKTVVTQAECTLSAVSQTLALMKKGAALAAVMYGGHPGGAAERNRLLQYAAQLNAKEFHAAHIDMVNQTSAAPSILILTKK